MLLQGCLALVPSHVEYCVLEQYDFQNDREVVEWVSKLENHFRMCEDDNLLDNYAVDGLSLTTKDRAKEPIATALSLKSFELEVE